MQTTQSQLREIVRRQSAKLVESKIESILQKCLKIIRSRVPIDTRDLQQEGITGLWKRDGDKYIIELFVNNLRHSSARLTMSALGLILNLQDKRRSQSQPKNPAGSSTAGWWNQAVDDIKDLANRNFD